MNHSEVFGQVCKRVNFIGLTSGSMQLSEA